MRVKRGTKARRRRKRALKHAEGYYGSRSRQYTDAIEQVHASWAYQYAHRRLRKRDFRRLWITRIGAAARAAGTSYSRLMAALREKGIGLDRKLLADLAVRDPGAFQAVVDAARK